MKKLIRIVRLSSKEGIKELKKKNPIFCNSLKKDFSVTNTFYQHILGYQKSRPNREVIERLSLINLIIKIANEGKVKETRENGKYEGEIYNFTYKISLKIGGLVFHIILGEQKSKKIVLLSCFVTDYRKI